MRYLMIDASLNGTGIRNYYEGGYIPPEDLQLSPNIIERLNEWLSKYALEHYKGFEDNNVIDELDREGKEIALAIIKELPSDKVEYFSDAKMMKEPVFNVREEF